jgi:Ni,Fe-hydrogenase maturation factor
MKRDDLDWSVIKLHSIIFVLVLLLSAGLIFGSWTFKEDMLHEYKRNKARFTSISQKYLAVDEDERIIRQYYPEFIALYKKGIVGREHRLNWIEILRASSERIKLPGLTYGVSPQEKYDPGFNINLGKFALYSSTMKLNISMLHEGDLSNLIKDLNEHAEGMFTITECTFKRSGKTLIQRRDATNIRADCELQWLNIRMADGSEIKLS